MIWDPGERKSGHKENTSQIKVTTCLVLIRLFQNKSLCSMSWLTLPLNQSYFFEIWSKFGYVIHLFSILTAMTNLKKNLAVSLYDCVEHSMLPTLSLRWWHLYLVWMALMSVFCVLWKERWEIHTSAFKGFHPRCIYLFCSWPTEQNWSRL